MPQKATSKQQTQITKHRLTLSVNGLAIQSKAEAVGQDKNRDHAACRRHTLDFKAQAPYSKGIKRASI